MLENIFEIVITLGGIGLLIKAWLSVTRQGKRDEINSLIGEGLMKPFGGQADKR